MRPFTISIFLIMLLWLITGCENQEGTNIKVTDKSTVAGEKDEWKESDLFKSGSYTMIGEEGKLGFIYDDSEMSRFYLNKDQKYMWHFWGNKQELTGDLKIIASSENTGKKLTILESPLSISPNNGADASLPSIMSLPKAGMWRLDAYINDNLFGSIFVKVHKG